MLLAPPLCYLGSLYKLGTHTGHAYWAGIMTVLFSIMPAQYACPRAGIMAQYACPRAGIMACLDFSDFFFQKLFPDLPGLHKTHFKAHIIRKMMMVLDLLQHYWFYST